MLKIHHYFAMVSLAFLLLILLMGGIVFYNVQSGRIQALTLESMSLLAEWNELRNQSYQILLNRFTVENRESPEEISNWEENYECFSYSLEKFSQNRQIKKLESFPPKVEGILRLWRYTEVQLNNARHYFNRIVQTGLGEKVMVNGFIHTMYKLRMSGQLTVSEIFLLDDTIYALESLDNASTEFDALFTLMISDLKDSGEYYLQHIRAIFFALFATIFGFLILLFLILKQLKRTQQNRNLYMENQRDQVLRTLIENSCDENLLLFTKRRKELGVKLDIHAPLIPLALQLDDYSSFSHRYSIEEQESIIRQILSFIKSKMDSEHYLYESCRHSSDLIVFLINTPENTDTDENRDFFSRIHKELISEKRVSVSMTCGNHVMETMDLDQEISGLLRMAEYRFFSGKGSFLYPGSSCITKQEVFHYPHEREKHFEEAIKSLDKKESLRHLKDLIKYGYNYGPQNMRRLIIRLTATLSSLVEALERNYHIQTIEELTPMILRIQNPETIAEVQELLSEIIVKVINACLKKKEEKHDITVSQVKALVKAELKDYNLSADSIADHFYLTSAYLNRLFKQHTSLSIAGYINQCRMDLAEELLRTSDMTIADIAEMSGFANLGTFFRLFKKKYGRTPGDYQKEAHSLWLSD